MAWTKTFWTPNGTDDTDPDKVRIDWCWKDTVDGGIRKRGTFDFTLVDDDTWAENKAAIQAKVDNGDGGRT